MQSTNAQTIADQPYLNLLSKVDFSPIFIMGDHRSGTTLLYKTLAATECFNYVKAYHIIKYDELLSNHLNHTETQRIEELAEQFKSLGISDRTIDNVIVTPELPEEYGFILKNIVDDESYITPKNLLVFQQLCKKIQLTSDSAKPLLLKNPWDFPQFMYVKEIIPNAKFVFIHRHPLHVINSKLKAVRILLSSWNPYTALIAQWYRTIFKNPFQRYLYQLLYSQYFNLGVRRVTEESLKSTTYFLQNVDSLSSQDYLSITYEDLCQEPQKTIEKILDFLGLEAQETLDYQKLIKPRPINLLPEVEKNAQKIRQQLQAYFTYYNYN
ncbi:sulfotransferase [Crocosphaera sp.]|uniref:sulfotransferase family protein n=1 Tax=Crocosphaera sp. TaxID=2729996 RepID=UPI00262A5886|nr:sulfotransferase [Crocosphaera sp.]MDJ0580567.1 sulfotransferase [Crocosphaera sp.]